MSDNENESIESIVAVMRHGLDQSWHDIDREWARELPDRIEAAWKRERKELDKRISDLEAYAKLWTDRADELRLKCDEFYAKAKPVGNAAAMREALREAIGETCAGCKRDCDDCMNLKSGWMKKAKAALAAPPRRCDVYAPDNAAHMMEVNYCGQMPPSHCDGTNCSRCSFKWFTSSEQEGGAA